MACYFLELCKVEVHLRRITLPRTSLNKRLRKVRPACSGGIIVVGERKMVPVSMDLFTMAATVFLVVLALAFVVFTAKYIRTRARGRGPLGLFSQPRHTFAQYD